MSKTEESNQEINIEATESQESIGKIDNPVENNASQVEDVGEDIKKEDIGMESNVRKESNEISKSSEKNYYLEQEKIYLERKLKLINFLKVILDDIETKSSRIIINL